MIKKFLAAMIVFGFVSVSASAQVGIVNPGFEAGDLSGWLNSGHSGVQNSIVHDGSYSAYVGAVDFDDDELNDFTGAVGDFYTNSYLGQSIDVTGMTSLSVWYKVYTWDYLDPDTGTEFDDPAFLIDVNGASALSVKASDVDTDPDPDLGVNLDWTSWMLFTYDLTGYVSPFAGQPTRLDLYFYAGNTIDREVQSWAYVDLAANYGVVPEPATLLLLGSGLLGLVGIRRRRSS